MALFDTRTRGSAIIWRIYMEFEIRFGDSKRLKGLLYRALSQCPFVKGAFWKSAGHL